MKEKYTHNRRYTFVDTITKEEKEYYLSGLGESKNGYLLIKIRGDNHWLQSKLEVFQAFPIKSEHIKELQ